LSIAKQYGLLMLTLLKNKTDNDMVCFELNLCSMLPNFDADDVDLLD
jgi:hypothetical protein